MHLLKRSAFGKVVIHYIDSIKKDKELRLFVITLFFYLALAFCSSNITMIMAILLYVAVLVLLAYDTKTVLFLSLIAVLPFANGKSLALLVLPKQLVKLNVQGDIYVYASIRISDIILGLNLYYLLTRRIQISISKSTVVATILFIIFLILTAASTVFSSYLEASVIDILQLFKICLIFAVALSNKEHAGVIWAIVVAGVLFEGAWGVLQYLHQGRLGRYLEYIPSAYGAGKIAWEQRDLLRVSGTFVDPDFYSTFLLIQLGLLVTSLRQKLIPIKNRFLVYSAIGFGVTGIILSGNRIMYILVAIVLLPMVWAIRSRIGTNKTSWFWTIAGISAIGILTIPYVLIRLKGLSTLFSPAGSGTFRVQMIVSSLRLGFENILGFGAGTSPMYLATKPLQEHAIYGPDFPHNLLMQIFAEGGIAGLGIFMMFFYVAFRNFFLNKVAAKSKPFYVASLLYFVSSLFYPLTFDGIEILSFGFLYLGIALASA
jgi:hypothetical protein